MSSSYDSVLSAKRAEEIRESKCPNSPDGNHKWKHHDHWPSTWGECKHCDAVYFDK